MGESKLMTFSDILDCVEKICASAKKIDGRIINLAEDILDKGPELEQDEWHFMQYFLSRNIEYGKSIVLLADEKCYYAGTVVGRTMLESMIYFKTYMWHPELAEIWWLHSLHEYYRKEYDTNGSALQTK